MCYLYFFIILFLLIFIFYILIKIFFNQEIKATIERDPAAKNCVEVIFTYSGLHALIFYRIAHFLDNINIPFFPRFISQFARLLTGIEIHPKAQIGKNFFIDHGMGTVIGETTIIGNNVTLFQGVTLGGTGKEIGKRHPTLKDNIVVGAGAKVLGNICIGNNVLIGANAVVLNDVPEDSTVVGVPGRIAKREGYRIGTGISLDHSSLPDPLQQSLEKIQIEIAKIEKEIIEHNKKKK